MTPNEELQQEYLRLQRRLALTAIQMCAAMDRRLGRKPTILTANDLLNLQDPAVVQNQLAQLRALRSRPLVRMALFAHRQADRSRLLRGYFFSFWMWARAFVWLIFPNLRSRSYSRWISRAEVSNLPTACDLTVVLWEPADFSELISSLQQSLTKPQAVVVVSRDSKVIAEAKGGAAPFGSSISVVENLAQLSQIPGRDFVVLTGRGRLARQALGCIQLWRAQNQNVKVAYGDCDLTNLWRQRTRPCFFPDFSLELLVSHNCFSHLTVISRECLANVSEFTWWEFLFQYVLSQKEEDIGHVRQILFHQRANRHVSWLAELDQALHNKYPQTKLLATRPPRLIWPLPEKQPLVSIVIPTKDRIDLLSKLVDGLLHKTDYDNLEILIVDNQSREAKSHQYFQEVQKNPQVRVLNYDRPFNYSAMNNMAASQSRGEILALLNNDLEIITDNWLKEMVREILRPEVGAVGAKLLYKNGFIQHAGVVMGIDQVSAHVHAFEYRSSSGYCNRLRSVQCYSAVTAACMVVRREVFELVGGFNEKDLAVAYNDVDFCLKIREVDFKIVWTPFAELYHLESASRPSDRTVEQLRRYGHEVQYMRARWEKWIQADPYYNPNLSLRAQNFQLRDL